MSKVGNYGLIIIKPLNQSQNMNQGLTVATIESKPRMKDVNVGVVTHVGATTGEDGPH